MRVSRSSSAHLELARAIARGDAGDVRARLAADPSLATVASAIGATRADAKTFFLAEIAHYMYPGDTALHIAAAAFNRSIAEMLVARGADCGARNGTGAEPLHYACDTNHWNPDAQTELIVYLISIGADPNALDKRGVAPIHRAVRTRSAPAVKALLEAGADPRLKNKSGSLPLDLARTTTGRGGSGSDHAKAQQAAIVELLTAAAGKAPTGRRA
jgi:ankyrin repeat protein